MRIIYILPVLMLAACATPTITLQNNQGKVVTCGGGIEGSMAGGLIGHTIQKSLDQDCVEEYKTQGYHVTDVKK